MTSRDYSVPPITKLLVMYFTIAFSAITFFTFLNTSYLGVFLILLFVLYRPKIRLNLPILLWLLYIIAIVVLQDALLAGFFSIKNIISWSVRLLLPLLVVHILKDDFLESYIWVMVVITLVAMILYVATLLIPSLGEFFIRYGKPADLVNRAYYTFYHTYARPYTYSAYQIIDRNYGPFPEPGMFALYLLIAILFNYMKYRTFFNFFGILFIIGILTTQSTAGYLALFIVFLYGFYQTRYRLLSWALLIVVLVGATYAYRLPFMKAKIENDRYIAATSQMTEAGRSRTHKAEKSLYSFSRNMVFGAGITFESEQQLGTEDIGGFSIMEVGRKTGLVGFILYNLGLLSSLLYFHIRYGKSQDRFGVIFAFLAILITVSSQQVAFYRIFMFAFIYYGLWNYRVLSKKHQREFRISNITEYQQSRLG